MNLRQQSLMAVVLFSIVLGACNRAKQFVGPGQHHGQEQGRVFEVFIYTDPTDSSHCYADAAVVTLWKTQNQRVKWISDDDKPYFVDFVGTNGSPFTDRTFSVPPHGDKESGNLTQSGGKYYEYGIWAGGSGQGTPCKQSSDPGIYVVK